MVALTGFHKETLASLHCIYVMRANVSRLRRFDLAGTKVLNQRNEALTRPEAAVKISPISI